MLHAEQVVASVQQWVVSIAVELLVPAAATAAPLCELSTGKRCVEHQLPGKMLCLAPHAQPISNAQCMLLQPNAINCATS
jgi:hypothetical protein